MKKKYKAVRIISALFTGILILSLFTTCISAEDRPIEEQAASYDQELAPFGSLLIRDLSTGLEGTDVTALQSMLYRLGYLPNSITGSFDEQTEAAVAAFQDDLGLAANGVVDRGTKEALNTILSNLSELPGFLIYDAILETGDSYTAKAYFEDGEDHEVQLSSNSPNISVSGMNITALSSGSAEVLAECEGRAYKFFVSVRDSWEISSKVGDLIYANNLPKGLAFRQQGLASYNGDLESLTMLVGDCFPDERLFLTEFESRFEGKNIYSAALSGSTTSQWKDYITVYYEYPVANLVLSIGTNDVRRGKSAETVIRTIQSLIRQIHQNMPDTMIYWWNIMPHLESEQDYYKIQAVNAAILEDSRQDSQLAVIDCYGAVTDENGVGDESLYRDPLHPNNAGYDRIFEKADEAGLVIADK